MTRPRPKPHTPRRTRQTPAALPAALLPAFLAAAFLPGCVMVGPDYREPVAGAPEQFSATRPADDASVQTTGDRAELAAWWSRLDDPVLTHLIERALASNLDVKLAAVRLWEARAQRGIAEGGLLPTLDASALYNRRGPATGVNSNQFRAGLDAAWEVDVFGGIQRSIESADADISAAIEDERGVRVSLAAEVALAYLDLRTQQARLDILQKSLETRRRTLTLTRQRREAGFDTGLDVAGAERAVAAAEAAIPSTQAAIQRAAYSLTLLLSREPSALNHELLEGERVGRLPTLPQSVPVGLPGDLLRRRPDIRGAEARIRSANAQIGAAVAELFPKLTLSGNVGFAANRITELSNWGSRAWSVGPSITWQIFDANRIRSTIQVRKAQTERALLNWNKAVLTAFNESDQALDALAREQMRTRPLGLAVAAARKALDLSTRLYVEGQSDFLNVLTAQATLLAAEDALLQNQSDVASNLVAVYKSLGGGWEAVPDRAAEAVPAHAPVTQ